MTYKDGVIIEVCRIISGKARILEISPEIKTAMEVADDVSRRVAKKSIVVTSIFDGIHSKNSFHYSGYAFDMRIYIYTKSQINKIMAEMRSILGNTYDILLEEDHIHVEYDPR